MTLETSTETVINVWSTDPDTYMRFVWNGSQTVRVYEVVEHDDPSETMSEMDVWSYSTPPTLETLREDCTDYAYGHHDLAFVDE